MGVVKAHTWKEFVDGPHTWKKLVEQAKIAEKLAKKFEPFVPKNKCGVNNKGRDTTQSSQAKGKEIVAIELFGETLSKPRRSNSNNNLESKFSQK